MKNHHFYPNDQMIHAMVIRSNKLKEVKGKRINTSIIIPEMITRSMLGFSSMMVNMKG